MGFPEIVAGKLIRSNKGAAARLPFVSCTDFW